MMNSFDFAQMAQSPLLEAANFEGPLNLAPTTQPATLPLTTSQESNPYSSIGLPGFPVEAIIVGLIRFLVHSVERSKRQSRTRRLERLHGSVHAPIRD